MVYYKRVKANLASPLLWHQRNYYWKIVDALTAIVKKALFMLKLETVSVSQ
jgi:hypothetical protein